MAFEDTCYFGHCGEDESDMLQSEIFCDCAMENEKRCDVGLDAVDPAECQYTELPNSGDSDITESLYASALETDCGTLNDPNNQIQETSDPPEVLKGIKFRVKFPILRGRLS